MLTKYYDEIEIDLNSMQEGEEGDPTSKQEGQQPVTKQHVIKNGTTTITFGYIYADNLIMGLEDKLHHVMRELQALRDSTYEKVKGVAKLSSEDTYDERTGVIVASRKAEYKAMKRQAKRLTAVKKSIEAMLAQVNEELAAVEARTARVKARMDSQK